MDTRAGLAGQCGGADRGQHGKAALRGTGPSNTCDAVPSAMPAPLWSEPGPHIHLLLPPSFWAAGGVGRGSPGPGSWRDECFCLQLQTGSSCLGHRYWHWLWGRDHGPVGCGCRLSRLCCPIPKLLELAVRPSPAYLGPTDFCVCKQAAWRHSEPSGGGWASARAHAGFLALLEAPAPFRILAHRAGALLPEAGWARREEHLG